MCGLNDPDWIAFWLQHNRRKPFPEEEFLAWMETYMEYSAAWHAYLKAKGDELIITSVELSLAS